MSVTVHGPRDARSTAVLLHGLGASGLEHFPIEGIPSRLAAAGIRTVIPDLLGHGSSRDPRAAIEPGDQLVALERALEQASIVPDGLVGYSLGARLAWELLDDPRFTRVVIGGLPPFEPMARLDLRMLAAAVEGSVAPEGPLTGLVGIVRGAGPRAPELMAVIRGLAAVPFDAPARARHGEVLLIGGEDDPLAAPEQLVERLGRATALRLPGDHASLPVSPGFIEAVVRHLTAD